MPSVTSALFTLLSIPLLASPVSEGAATELRYSGTLVQTGRNAPADPVKRCELYCLVSNSESGGYNLSYLVDERGGEGWAWPERFGRIRLDASGKPTDKRPIKLLHNHQDSLYPLSVRQPVFEFAGRLKPDAEWIDGKYAYVVRRGQKIKDRDCWQVDVSTNFGRMQTLWVDKNTSLLAAFEQRVFMGRGDEFVLKMELESANPIDEERWQKLQKPLATLLELQRALGREEDETDPELNDAQIKTATTFVDRLERDAHETPFSRLAAVVNRDVKAQLQRSGDVANLSKKFLGQKAPQFSLRTIDDKTIESNELSDSIVVLHFWEYRDDPLVEPYGQVGYLDFLNSRRRKLGVQIVGVAVNSLLEDPARRSLAVRSTRKLKEFMNLSYPIATDDGTLLRKLGDPRSLGAKLPLWVVVAPDGTIAHYKVGYYDIKPDEGLRPLDDAVVELIRKQRGK